MLLAGKAANAAGAPVVLDPVGVGATTFRTRDGEADPRRGRRRDRARERGRGRRARRARRRRSAASSRSVRRAAAPRSRARPPGELGVVAVGDRPRRPRLGRRRARWPSRTAIRCSRRSPARAASRPRSRAASRPCAGRVGRGCGVSRSRRSASRPRPQRTRRSGPGTFHARLYDGLYALTPEALDPARSISDA